MKIDTGAACVPHLTSHTKSHESHSITRLKLRSYTKHLIGTMKVEVKYEGYTGAQTLYVVEGCGPSLFGRDWLNEIRINWQEICTVMSTIPSCVEKYAEVFRNERGTMANYKAHLSLRDDARPRFYRARQVPFSMRDAVGRELDRMEKAGITRKVIYSEWASPIVSVPKKDGSLRICGDYKVSINPYMEVDQHPLPNPTELMVKLTGGRKLQNWICLQHTRKCCWMRIPPS